MLVSVNIVLMKKSDKIAEYVILASSLWSYKNNDWRIIRKKKILKIPLSDKTTRCIKDIGF